MWTWYHFHHINVIKKSREMFSSVNVFKNTQTTLKIVSNLLIFLKIIFINLEGNDNIIVILRKHFDSTSTYSAKSMNLLKKKKLVDEGVLS